MSDPLKILAVSAPENISGTLGAHKIYSRDPASLFNAMRIAAAESENPTSVWHHSNFAGGRKERREKLQLMYSLDDMSAFEAKLRKEKPSVLFIGAMTLALPGAVEIAKKAREILGNDVLIVLGGRHATETIYKESTSKDTVPLGIPGQPKASAETKIKHHPGSPLALMQQHKIPPVFDLVVAGQGEYVIGKLGEIADKARKAGDVRQIEPYLDELKASPGDWIAGYVKDRNIHTVVGNGKPINYNNMPSPARLFGVRAAFDVFDGNPTAHVYSDTGMGCIYSCDFCSEGTEIVGKPTDLKHAPERLHRQLKEAAAVMREDYPDKKPTAFVEDSVFLGGDPKNINRFCELMRQQPVEIEFGAQFTVDQILNHKDEILKLKEAGLRYIFVGIETLDPQAIGGMPKDIGQSAWAERSEKALKFLSDNGIKSGAALLFGLGESHASRLALLDKVEEWQKLSPTALRPVSANWAVQHPLKGHDHGANYDYTEWGTPENSSFLPYFNAFGEASIKYTLHGTQPPSLEEVKEIHARIQKIRGEETVRIEGDEINPSAVDPQRVIAFTSAGFPNTAAYNHAVSEAVNNGSLHYGNIGSPTTDTLAQHIAELEGGKYGYLTPTGHAAITQTLSTVLKPGDHVLVVDSTVYSTRKYFCDSQLVKMGVEVEYYDPAKGDDIRKHLKPNTKAIYMESPGAYTHEIQSVDAIAKVARDKNILTVMDNTWSASTFFKPFEHGVDVSVVSLGKYHFGSTGTPMGAVVTQDKSLRDDIKKTALSFGMRVSPRDAKSGWDALKTLEDRMKMQQDSAREVSSFLATRPEVKEVLDPALPSSPDHTQWKQDFTGANSLVPIELRPDLPKGYAAKLQDELAAQGVVTVGDGYGGSFSLSTAFDPKQHRTASTPRQEGECIRFYVGHDRPDVIKRHLQTAFEKTNQALRTR